jgi:hypothetical protein
MTNLQSIQSERLTLNTLNQYIHCMVVNESIIKIKKTPFEWGSFFTLNLLILLDQ